MLRRPHLGRLVWIEGNPDQPFLAQIRSRRLRNCSAFMGRASSPLARVFSLVPSASQWFGLLWVAPLLILLADDARKALRRGVT